MAGHDIIVVGASAGGVEALGQMFGTLPADLAASLFVVHHFPPFGRSMLPSILSRRGPLRAEHARDGEPIRPGQIYVAPPNYHMLVRRGRLRLARGPRENGHRPAIDPLFRTAALSYGLRVVGVVLSGTLDDGTTGLQVIKQRGGVAIVQDPEDALYAGMPRSALEKVAVDHVAPASRLGALLARLAQEEVRDGGEPVSDDIECEAELAELELEVLQSDNHPGSPSTIACPECGGTLWELSEGDIMRFRCRVGHVFMADALLSAQTEALEAALWTALRALEERAALSRRLTERAQRRGHLMAVKCFTQQVADTEQRATVIRAALLRGAELNPAPVSGDQEARMRGEQPPAHAPPHD
jgi:two-component system chemotaxis response regulator CheB